MTAGAHKGWPHMGLVLILLEPSQHGWHDIPTLAADLEVHRATVYRWLKAAAGAGLKIEFRSRVDGPGKGAQVRCLQMLANRRAVSA